MKLALDKNKELVARLMATSKGKIIDFDSVFPGIKERTQAICVEADPIRYFWQFNLMWMAVSVGEVAAEINGKDLIVELL
jgi:hypothetical protein